MAVLFAVFILTSVCEQLNPCLSVMSQHLAQFDSSLLLLLLWNLIATSYLKCSSGGILFYLTDFCLLGIGQSCMAASSSCPFGPVIC